MSSFSTVKLYGAFKDRAVAHRKAAEVKGWVDKRVIRGAERWVVMAGNTTQIQRKRYSRRSAMNPPPVDVVMVPISNAYYIHKIEGGKSWYMSVNGWRDHWKDAMPFKTRSEALKYKPMADYPPYTNPPKRGRIASEVYAVEQDGIFAVQYSNSLSWTPRIEQATRFDTRAEAEALRDSVATQGLPHAKVTTVRVYRQQRNPRSLASKSVIVHASTRDEATNAVFEKVKNIRAKQTITSLRMIGNNVWKATVKFTKDNPGGRKVSGTEAFIAQHPERDPRNPYLLVVKSGAGVTTFGLSVREAKNEQQRGVPFLSDSAFRAMVPDFGKENPVQIGYRSRKSGKLRGFSIGRIHENPPGGERIIYHSVKRIYAQKGPGHKCDAECRKCGHLYVHKFGPGVRCIGLANGDVLLTKRR